MAGTFVAQAFDLDTAAFTVSYNLSSSSLQSEVYVSREYHYPRGYSVAFQPPNCCTWSMASNTIMTIRRVQCVAACLFACGVVYMVVLSLCGC